MVAYRVHFTGVAYLHPIRNTNALACSIIALLLHPAVQHRKRLLGAWSKKEQELAWRDRVLDDENVNCEDPFLRSVCTFPVPSDRHITICMHTRPTA